VAGLEADIQGLAGGSSTATSATGAAFPVLRGPRLLAASRRTRASTISHCAWPHRLSRDPTLLLYGTGGLAYGGANSSSSVFQGYNGLSAGVTTAWGTAGSYSDTLVGWTAGAGVNGCSCRTGRQARISLLRSRHGLLWQRRAGQRRRGDGCVSVHQRGWHDDKFDGHIVRAGVNYHFNWGAPAPVLAKY